MWLIIKDYNYTEDSAMHYKTKNKIQKHVIQKMYRLCERFIPYEIELRKQCNDKKPKFSHCTV